MPFTATLKNVSKDGDPTVFSLQVIYLNSDLPAWSENHELRISFAPGLTGPQMRDQLETLVRSDAALYLRQQQIYDGLLSLVDQTLVIT